MNTYTIYLGYNPIACVSDTERAYACYEAAMTIAEMTSRTASLVWDETGEEVAYFDPNEVEEEESTSSCLHCSWCWIGEGEDYPRCHFEGAVAPCEEEDDYYEDDVNECGYDPYMGCYTDDC